MLPPGVTIVLIILATNKTLITKLYSNKSAWLVYISIGNLTRKVCQIQIFLGSLLVSLLPISKDILIRIDMNLVYKIKSALYY